MCVFLRAGLVGLSTSDRILTSYAIDCLYQKRRRKGRVSLPELCVVASELCVTSITTGQEGLKGFAERRALSHRQFCGAILGRLRMADGIYIQWCCKTESHRNAGVLSGAFHGGGFAYPMSLSRCLCLFWRMQATRASSVRRTETATRGLEWTMTKRPQLVMSESASTPGQRTLAIDVGGTGLKASVLDARGQMLADPVRVETPYPCPPSVLVEALVQLVKPLPAFDRVSVGFPGVVRHGEVITAPHFGNAVWRGFAFAEALAARFATPVRLLNDADMQGLAVIKGAGIELVVTLGTGIGTA